MQFWMMEIVRHTISLSLSLSLPTLELNEKQPELDTQKSESRRFNSIHSIEFLHFECENFSSHTLARIKSVPKSGAKSKSTDQKCRFEYNETKLNGVPVKIRKIGKGCWQSMAMERCGWGERGERRQFCQAQAHLQNGSTLCEWSDLPMKNVYVVVCVVRFTTVRNTRLRHHAITVPYLVNNDGNTTFSDKCATRKKLFIAICTSWNDSSFQKLNVLLSQKKYAQLFSTHV